MESLNVDSRRSSDQKTEKKKKQKIPTGKCTPSCQLIFKQLAQAVMEARISEFGNTRLKTD